LPAVATGETAGVAAVARYEADGIVVAGEATRDGHMESAVLPEWDDHEYEAEQQVILAQMTV
jgi:hypothetical protein